LGKRGTELKRTPNKDGLAGKPIVFRVETRGMRHTNNTKNANTLLSGDACLWLALVARDFEQPQQLPNPGTF
jgi:hypothetical protein